MFNFLGKSIVTRFNAILLTLIIVGLLGFSMGIGFYNYNRTIQELIDKSNTLTGLASISLKEPVWNIDEKGLASIAEAIFLDKDVVGLLVFGEDGPETSTLISKKRGSVKDMKFQEMEKFKQVLYVKKPIRNDEGAQIGAVHMITTTLKAKELIEYTTMMILLFAFGLILIMGFITWITGRTVILKPIKALEESANQLAGGKLNTKIDVSRKDELGRLAHSFADMRDSIRKKIEDLHILNITGETLAGMHSQTEALKTALKVMKQQTHVQWGSIYLLKEKNELHMDTFHPEREDATTPQSFQLGEGIAGKAAAENQIIYIADTSKEINYIKANSTDEPRALLCVPMMDDKEVFGVMNFSGQVGEVQFEKSDQEFALTIARMTVVATKNIQMLEVIKEQNRTLEQKVEERTAELKQKSRDIQNMLENMHQGIFTVIDDNVIHPEYSLHLEEILETREIAGVPVMDFLFSNTDIGADVFSQIETAIDALIGCDLMMFDFNAHLLVSEITKTFSDGKTKIIEIDWDPITNDLNEIEKLMITVRDVTLLRGLQAEAEQQRQELEIIGQILSISQEKFQSFLKTSHDYISENEKLIQQTNSKDPEVIATLFRNMHTIKGNARTYGFNHLTDAIHEAEQTYQDLRKIADVQWSKARLLNELHSAENYIDKYEQLYQSKLSGLFAGQKGVLIPDALYSKIKEALLKSEMDKIAVLMEAVDTENMEAVLEGIIAAIPSLSEQLGKTIPRVKLVDNQIRIKKDIIPVLKDIFMHIFRNSLDHGLELPDERKATGKPDETNITLEANYINGKLTFVFQDDGRGLALPLIRQKAIENGLMQETQEFSDEEIATFLFKSGVSTAESITNVSGRGVGMDAVKNFLKKYGGEIEIKFTGEKRENGFRPFAQVMTLPKDISVQLPS
ncbi:HAMP domain-containing protein [Deltaproteobacteria bacterium TL4]